MSDQAVLLPKYFLNYAYFDPVQIFMRHPIAYLLFRFQGEGGFFFIEKQ